MPQAIVAGAIAIVYANSVGGAFVLDDQASIVQNPQIRDLAQLPQVLVPAADSPIAGRPLASLSFALNYAAGGLDVRGYHLVNITLHAVSAVLLLLIVRRTLETTAADGLAGMSSQVALAAALLWGLHPLNSEVVDYLSQRTESLMASCYLATLYASLRAWRAPRHSARRWSAAAIFACALGTGAKESIATAPLMVALYDRVFLYSSWRASFAERRWLYAGLATTWLLVGWSVWSGARAAVVGFDTGYSAWTYLLNQAVVITEYLRLTFWPDRLVAFYGWPSMVVFADVAPQFMFIAALLGIAAVVLWRWPRPGYLGAWFFVTLAPASSIVPVATEVGAERRMYLPLMALACGAALAIYTAVSRLSARPGQDEDDRAPLRVRLKGLAAALVAVLAFGCVVVTILRNREYQSALTLAQTIVERRPTAVAHHILAEQLLLAGRSDEAIPHLRQAVAAGNSRAGYELGRALAERGDDEAAMAALDAYLRAAERRARLVPRWLEPPASEVLRARWVLGRTHARRGQWDQVVEQANLILALAPEHAGGRALMADAMFAKQQWGAAAEHYRRYLAREPADATALVNYGITQVAVENLDAAIDAFSRAATLNPTDPRARQLLAMAREDRQGLSARP